MIYDKFKAKIDKLTGFLRILKKFRVLILSILGAILAVTGSLLATKGIIHGEISCPSIIVYGDSLSLRSEAFMSDVSYEYCGEDGNWSSQMPNKPGVYRVRAVADAAFGGKRYNHETEFVIQPKTVTISVLDNVLQYGALPNIKGDFISGDTATFSVQYLGLNTETIQIQPANIRISNAKGEDVTSCYTIIAPPKTVELTKAPLTIQISDATHVYDGTEFTSTDYQVTSGGVVVSDRINAAFDGVSVINAGDEATNTASFTFTALSGIDVTNYYEVECIPGTLSVTKRPLHIVSASDSKTYDGTPLVGSGYEVGGETSFAVGQTFGAITPAEITQVGEIINEPVSVEVVDGNGNTVTSNYEIEYSQDASLTVTTRAFAVTSETKSNTYDGNRFTWEYATIDTDSSLATGDTIEYIFAETAGVTTVGEKEVDNAFTVKITNDYGEDVTYCYGDTEGNITYTFGKLSITPRPIKVNSIGYTWTYDGAIHTDTHNYTQAEMDVDDATTYLALVGSHELRIKEANSVQFVWDTEGVGCANDVTFSVYNGEEDVSENYAINTDDKGVLKINPRTIDIQTHSHSWTYDGIEHKDHENCESGGITNVLQNGTTLGEKDYLTVISAPGVTVGEIANAVEFGFGREDYTGANNIADNYIVNRLTDGTLKILGRPILVRPHDCTWTYDGYTHSDGDGLGDTHEYGVDDVIVDENAGYYSLLEGHTLQFVESYSSITTVNESGGENSVIVKVVYADGENKGEEVLFRDGDGIDQPLYLISYTNDVGRDTGKLNITKREITISTGSKAWTYDGDAHSYIDEDKVSVGTLADNQSMRLVSETFITDWVEGGKENANVYEIIDINGVNVSDENYIITPDYGTLTINKLAIVITTPSASWTYDGQFHSKTDGATADNLAKYWHTLQPIEDTICEVRYVDDSGDNTTEYYVSDGVNDISHNYEITSYNHGTLTITPVYLSITAHSCVWTYDGQNHHDGETGYGYSNTDATATDENGYLVDFPYTDSLKLTSCSEIEATKVEEYITNTVDFALYHMDGDKEVPANNYVFDVIPGTLYIAKAHIDLTAASDSKVYDGTPLTNNGVTASGYDWDNLVQTHTAEAEMTADSKVTFFDEGIVYNVINPDTIKITHATLGEVTNCFVIDNYNKGELTITKAPITITASSDSKTYDAAALTCADWTYKFNSEIKTAHTVSATTVGSRTNVGTAANVIDEWSVYNDEADRDVTNCFMPTFVNGKLTVNKLTIKIKTHDVSWVYDGNVHSDGEDGTEEYTTSDIVEGNLALPTHKLRVINATQVQYVCSVTNEITIEIYTDEYGVYDDSDNELFYLSDNYDIRYENAGTATITKRAIYIVAHNVTWTYDGQDHKDGDGYGDTQLYGASDVNPYADGETYYTLPIMDSLQIDTYTTIDATNVVGTDREQEVQNEVSFTVWQGYKNVTDCYEIKVDFENSYLTITKAHIDLTAASDSKTYDGTPLTNNGVTASSYDWDNLVQTHTAEAKMTAESTVTFVDEGIIYNVIDRDMVTITHPTLGDVTDCFVIDNYNDGELYITKAPITITAESDSKTYDAAALTCADWTYKFNSEIKTKHIVDAETLGKRTNAGMAANKIYKWSVYNEEADRDVTCCFEPTLEDGTLTVMQRKIVINTHDVSWTYDGKSHQDGEEGTAPYTTEDIVEGTLALPTHKLMVGYAPYVKYVKEPADNTATFVVYDEVAGRYDDSDGDMFPLTGNYLIEYGNVGTASITPRPIYIVTHDVTWTYDGLDHYDGDGYGNTRPYGASDVIACEEDGVKYLSFPEMDSLQISENLTQVSATHVFGTERYNETFNNLDFTVWCDTENVSDNYNIKVEARGKLTIVKARAIITTNSDRKTYDGEPLTNSDYTKGGDWNNLRKEHTIDVTVTGSQTDFGWSYNTVDVNSIVIRNENGAIVTDCFEDFVWNSDNISGTLIYGKLTIDKRPITITTAGKDTFTGGNAVSWMYDGNAHSNTYYEITSQLGLVEGKGHKLVRTSTATVINVDDTKPENNANKYEVRIGNDNSVNNNYEISYEYGILEITPRPIYVVTENLEWKYDGKEHKDTRPYYPTDTPVDGVDCTTLVSGHRLTIIEATAGRYVSDSGKTNALKFIVDGTPYQNNYDIKVNNAGKLIVNKADIEIYVNGGGTQTKTYDGEPFNATITNNLTSEMAKLHTVNVTAKNDGVTDAGTYAVSIDNYEIVNTETGVNVNDCFNTPTYVNGILVINKKNIVINRTHNITWYYDGNAHYDGNGVADIYGNTYTADAYHDAYKGEMILKDVNDGWKIAIKTNTKITNQGWTDNSLTFAVMKDGVESGNYSVGAQYKGILTIETREITIRAVNQTKEYDGKSFLVSGSTAGVHYEIVSGTIPTGYAIEVTYTASLVAPGSTQNYEFNCKLLKNGVETTDTQFSIMKDTSYTATMTVTKRAITLSINAVSYPYDGLEKRIQANDQTAYTLYGELVSGHTINVINSGATRTEVGSAACSITSWTITDANSNVVAQSPDTFVDGQAVETDYYVVMCWGSNLTITKPTVVINLGTKNVVYNGQANSFAALTMNSWANDTANGCTVSGLANGQTLTWSTPSLSKTEPGTYTVAYDTSTLQIKDSNGNNVKDNYDLSVTGGTLTIERIALWVTTEGATRKFEPNNPLTNNVASFGYLTGAEVSGHTLAVKATGSQLEVGTSQNTYQFTLQINGYTQSQAVFNTYYTVTNESLGNLVVTPCYEITITAASASKPYDGTPLTKNASTDYIISGTLMAGHKVTVENFGSITQIAVDENGNEINSVENVLINYYITDGAGNDVSGYYDITTGNGTLTIDKSVLSLQANSAEKVYDGTPLTCGEYSYVSGNLPSGHNMTLSMTADSTITEVGAIANQIDRESIVITNAKGENVTHCFNIYLYEGELRVTKAEITISTYTANKVYDGTPLTSNGYTSSGDLIQGHTLHVTPNGSITTYLYGGVKNTFTYEIWANGKALTAEEIEKYYIVNENPGTLSITRRSITVYTRSASKPYGGTPLSCPEIEYIGGWDDLLTKHTYTTSDWASITKVGNCPNSVTLTIYNEKNEDVTNSFNIAPEYGTLEVYKPLLTISAESAQKEYDGTALTASFTVNGLMEHLGHTLIVETVGSQTDVGESENKIDKYTLYIEGVETKIDDYYDVRVTKAGTLTVTKREIIIDASGYWAYDGEEHYVALGEETVYRPWYLDGNALVAGHTLQVDGEYHKVKYVCSFVENETNYKVFDGDTDVSTNYDISYEGTLTVNPIALTITSASDAKKYDGTPLINPNVTVEGYFDETHTLSWGQENAAIGQQIEVGSSYNTINPNFVLLIDGEEFEFEKIYYVIYNEGYLQVYDSSINGGGTGNVGEGNGGTGFDMTGDLDSSQQDGSGIGSGEGMGEEVVMFHVTTSQTGKLYLRQESFGDYYGNGWSDTVDYYVDGESYSALEYVARKIGSIGNVVRHNATITAERTGAPYWLPYYSTYTQQNGLKNDVFANISWNNSYVTNYYEFDALNYLKGMPMFGAGMDSVETAYAKHVENTYLQIDETTKQALLAIAEEKGVSGTGIDLILKVQNLVQNYRKYNLETSGYSENIALEFFDKATKGGYCQHFATAAAMMYRAFGIPARYVGGYMVDVETGVETAVTNQMAHAWVEIYMEGLGWIPVEVTGSAQSGGEGGGSGGDNEGGGSGGGSGEPAPITDPLKGLILTIKPVDVLEHWTIVQQMPNSTIFAPQEIEEVNDTVLEWLEMCGYTYEFEVSGSMSRPGTGYSAIDWFCLYDSNGTLVYDSNNPSEELDFTVLFEDGEIFVTQEYIIEIELYKDTHTYDGQEHRYLDEYYATLDKLGVPYKKYNFTYNVIGGSKEDAKYVFDIDKVPTLTDANTQVTEEQWLDAFTIYDATGENITSQCVIRFVALETKNFMIDPLEISIKPRNVEARESELNGEALTCSAYEFLSNSSILATYGHTIVDVTYGGSLSIAGTAYSWIEDYRIVDKDGIDVTHMYNVKLELGLITVTDN